MEEIKPSDIKSIEVEPSEQSTTEENPFFFVRIGAKIFDKRDLKTVQERKGYFSNDFLVNLRNGSQEIVPYNGMPIEQVDEQLFKTREQFDAENQLKLQKTETKKKMLEEKEKFQFVQIGNEFISRKSIVNFSFVDSLILIETSDGQSLRLEIPSEKSKQQIIDEIQNKHIKEKIEFIKIGKSVFPKNRFSHVTDVSNSIHHRSGYEITLHSPHEIITNDSCGVNVEYVMKLLNK